MRPLKFLKSHTLPTMEHAEADRKYFTESRHAGRWLYKCAVCTEKAYTRKAGMGTLSLAMVDRLRPSVSPRIVGAALVHHYKTVHSDLKHEWGAAVVKYKTVCTIREG